MPDTIAGQQVINIGLPNESANSDSLYTAFNKTKDNFANLFSKTSPFTSINGVSGITVAYGNSNTSVDLTNDSFVNKIRGQLYQKLKKDIKTIVDCEFEF